ncbi:MAG: photosynthetic complex putative assembly protein PuhB [Rhodopila sp.]
MNIVQHDYEPIIGLPAPLPAGETILWQGSPDWKTLARRAMRIRLVAFYFVLLLAWNVASGISAATPVGEIALPALWLVLVGAGAIGLLTVFAALVARTTIYTVTTKRVVIRFGIAIPMTIQVSYPMIEAAAVQTWPNGAGDVAITLIPKQRIGYLIIWPHARPWKLAKAQPTLRCIPDAANVAQLLGRGLAASAAQPATAVPVADKEAADTNGHVTAAA